jgi:hypothetical protein
MKKIDQPKVGGLEPGATGIGEPPPPRAHGAFYFGPVAGMIALLVAVVSYRPLDEKLAYWIGAIPCLLSWIVIIYVRRAAKRGKDVRPFVPMTKRLALGSLCVPMVLLANGGLDHSPVEQHRETVTRTILEYGRRGSIFYYLELTSWRPHRSHEKIGVSEWKYLDYKVGDPVIVETRKGALGIPLLVSIHMPD